MEEETKEEDETECTCFQGTTFAEIMEEVDSMVETEEERLFQNSEEYKPSYGFLLKGYKSIFLARVDVERKISKFRMKCMVNALRHAMREPVQQ